MNTEYAEIISMLIAAIKTKAKIDGKARSTAFLSNKQFDRVEKLTNQVLKMPNWMKAFVQMSSSEDDCVAVHAIDVLMRKKALKGKIRDECILRVIRYANDSGLAGLTYSLVLNSWGVNMLNKDKPNFHGRV